MHKAGWLKMCLFYGSVGAELIKLFYHVFSPMYVLKWLLLRITNTKTKENQARLQSAANVYLPTIYLCSHLVNTVETKRNCRLQKSFCVAHRRERLQRQFSSPYLQKERNDCFNLCYQYETCLKAHKAQKDLWSGKRLS